MARGIVRLNSIGDNGAGRPTFNIDLILAGPDVPNGVAMVQGVNAEANYTDQPPAINAAISNACVDAALAQAGITLSKTDLIIPSFTKG